MTNKLLEKLCAPKTDTSEVLLDSRTRSQLQSLIDGVRENDNGSCGQFHQLLFHLNRMRLSTDQFKSIQQEQWVRNICSYLELAWYTIDRQNVIKELVDVPTGMEAFVSWFEGLEDYGYGQQHPVLIHLAERADWKDFQYFFRQESSSEAGFDDLVALTQIKTSGSVKMELASNYWDEMGRGNPKGIHGTLLRKVSRHFNIAENGKDESTLWGPLALSNMMVAFAMNRSLFYQSVGALGVIELTAPSRCNKVIQGMKRIGVPAEDYHYYTLHASLDRKHWEGWRENVLLPSIMETTSSCLKIAEGGLLRLYAGQRCFEQYAKVLLKEELELSGACA